eukprot:6084864-Alexandrium_andersonii.AAC.1
MPPTATPLLTPRTSTPTPRAILRGSRGGALAPPTQRAGMQRHPTDGGIPPATPVGRPTGGGGADSDRAN